jgi:hypothetical protein
MKIDCGFNDVLLLTPARPPFILTNTKATEAFQSWKRFFSFSVFFAFTVLFFSRL